MVKKRVSKETSNEQKKVHTDKLLIVTISLLSALLILNVVALTGYSVRFTTDYGSYFGGNPCEKVGGVLLREGVSANYNDQKVYLRATTEDAVSVVVGSKKATIKSGHEVWVNGVTITNFASTLNDACLVLK